MARKTMIQLKIVHKGLILVAIPLIFGTAFISILFFSLSDANRLVERELLLKDAMITQIKASRCAVATRLCATCYLASHDQFYKETYTTSKKQALEANNHLRDLLKNEKSLQVPELHLSGRQMLTGGMSDLAGGGMSAMGGGMGAGAGPEGLVGDPIVRKLQGMIDSQNKAALNAMQFIEISLWSGLVAGVVISLVLAVFFCLNITQRLLIIINNTMSLSKGTALCPPLKGSDEIAELDQFLYKSANEIRELERFKKEMIGVVSHELKSPLTSVGAFLQSLSAGVFGDLGAKAQDKAQRTYASVKRLMGLVAELLYLDRLELDMSPELINVDDLVKASIDTVKELSEQSGIEIVAKSNGGKLYADRNRLIQVTVNLLSNALKFSPPNGQVTIEAKGGDDAWFECRISDQGRGIPEEFRKQIFEPFKQVDAKDATTKKGTGLGLTISRSIVEQHGGSIGADSAEGKGSTFWFKIPPKGQSTAKQPAAIADKQPDESKRLPQQIAPVQLGVRRGGSTGKFGVMWQGLTIISVPLIFQLIFIVVIASMLNQVHEQTKREETSKEILNSLNKMADSVIGSSRQAMMYAFTKSPALQKRWEQGKDYALNRLDHALNLSTDPEQIKDMKATRVAIENINATVENDAKENSSRNGLQKVMELTGVDNPQAPSGSAMSEMLGAMASNNRLNRATTTNNKDKSASGQAKDKESNETNDSADGRRALREKLMQAATETAENGPSYGNSSTDSSSAMSAKMMRRMAGMSGRGGMERGGSSDNGDGEMGGMGKLMQAMGGMQQMMQSGQDADSIPGLKRMMGVFARMGGVQALGEMGGMQGMGGLGAMGMIGQMKSLFSDSIAVKIVKPFLQGSDMQNKIMAREKAIGEGLSQKRAEMIMSLQNTLITGIALNAILSVCLAVILTRSLTGRLQHVMENTAHLVKREALDPPREGSDEIAYLDQILFETGKRLVELETFKHELISIVSHELRTPLLSISSALQLFDVGMLGELTDKGKTRLKFAQEECNRLVRLINDLLDIEKMEAGKFVLDITQTKVADAVTSAISAAAELAELKHITLKPKFYDAEAIIWVDRDRLTQVLINLLSNAIKYSPEDELIKIDVEKSKDEPKHILFSVIDHGRGIPEQLREKIFDRFVQVEKSDETVRGGSGLGLAITKAIVEQHGGKIGVESQMGYGSTFWFSLPIARNEMQSTT